MKRVLTITTVNIFRDEAQWQIYKHAMKYRLGSLIDFKELEKTGNFEIKSGDDNDGAESLYTLEVKE